MFIHINSWFHMLCFKNNSKIGGDVWSWSVKSPLYPSPTGHRLTFYFSLWKWSVTWWNEVCLMLESIEHLCFWYKFGSTNLVFSVSLFTNSTFSLMLLQNSINEWTTYSHSSVTSTNSLRKLIILVQSQGIHVNTQLKLRSG